MAVCVSKEFAGRIIFGPLSNIMVVVKEAHPAAIPSMVRVGVVKALIFACIMNLGPWENIPTKNNVTAPDTEISKERRKGAVLAVQIFVK